MTRVLFLFLVLALSASVRAQVDQKINGKQWAYYGEGFYRALSSKTVTKLLLNDILNDIHTSIAGKYDVIASECKTSVCYAHTSVGYSGARLIMFGELYVQKDNVSNFVTDVYCQQKFHYKQASDVSNMGSEVNIEHTWPQSKFSSGYNKDTQKSDMHHLFPSHSQANSRRGNYEFGDVDERSDELNIQDCSASKFGNYNGHPAFTPPVTHRGNVARSLFYFASHYGLQISSDQEAVLRKWHKADAVDAAEVARHAIIAKYQKVRNPFVDHPELVDSISDF